MKMYIKEFAGLTGVSVRTLHYYDGIGLLSPAFVDEQTGYRFYDEKSLLRMEEILFYRELDFPLKSIKEILSSPDYDKNKALEEQKHLLILKKERLERLISAIENAAKGESIMKAFDNSEFEKYKAEAKEKWGKTEAYSEFSKKTAGYSAEKWSEASSGMESIFSEFADCMKSGAKPSDVAALELVGKLRDFITDNYYLCTKEILFGLGKMYAADERFKKNIDKSGEGTAEFVSSAIEIYCK